MNHLKIIQGNNQSDTEEVDMDIINKLYELASSGDLDAASELKGCLHLQVGERAKMEYLTNMFPNKLFITANNYVVPFEDPNMVTYLNSIGVGSNGMVTEAQATAATVVANSQNTTVRKFNELKYFTNITESRGGWDSSSDGYVRFANWTALEEVDISNFTSLGHNNGYGWGDTFYGCTSLKKVKGSDKLSKIGHNAFSDCLNLEEITGLQGVITVGSNSFYGCKKLKGDTFDNCELFFLNNGTNISSVFVRCETIDSITLANGTTTIGSSCFYGCTSLASINLGNVTKIDHEAFRYCAALTSVDLSPVTTFSGNNQFTGCTSLTTVILGSSLTSISTGCFEGCTSLSTINIPSSLASIGDSAFNGCNQLTLNASNLNNITYFGYQAFYNSAITGNLVLNASTTFNDSGRQFSRTSLTSIDCSNTSVTAIPRSFIDGDTSLTSVTLSSSITRIGPSAFSGCTALTTIGVGNVTTIDDYAFYQCTTLTTLDLSNVTTIGNRAFFRTYDLTNITSLASVTSIAERAFNSSGLSGAIALPNVSDIGSWAFVDCSSLTSVDFTGSTFTTFPNQIFESCQNLDYVVINSSVTAIGSEPFKQCNNLRYVKILATSVPTSNGIFNYNSSGFKVYVPDAALTDYQSASGWSNYSSRIFPMSQFATDFPNG